MSEARRLARTASLRERALFEQVSVNQEAGTIVWPNGADFAPEWLYEAINAQHAST
jgi:hypothetical protein